jgi:hypothetical protein
LQGLSSFLQSSAQKKINEETARRQSLAALLPTLAARGMVRTSPTPGPGTVEFGGLNLGVGQPQLTGLEEAQAQKALFDADLSNQIRLEMIKSLAYGLRNAAMIQSFPGGQNVKLKDPQELFAQLIQSPTFQNPLGALPTTAEGSFAFPGAAGTTQPAGEKQKDLKKRAAAAQAKGATEYDPLTDSFYDANGNKIEV